MFFLLVFIAGIVIIPSMVIFTIACLSSLHEQSEMSAIQNRFVGKCIAMPPISSAKIIQIIPPDNVFGDGQPMIEVLQRDRNGNESVVFPPAQFVLRQVPMTCE